MTEGYIYCLSHKLIEGDFSIGIWEKNEDKTFNKSRYKLLIVKYVKNPKEKCEILQSLFKGFTNISDTEIINFFKLMDGEIWNKCRDLKTLFNTGQRIRHNINVGCWFGEYDCEKNIILFNGEEIFPSLNQFVKKHYENDRNDRTSSANGWAECEYLTSNGVWKNMEYLSPRKV